MRVLKPWVSAGYSYGSGDGNPNDTSHGTFFQDLPTPRQYARFPFYNMMNNEDLYATFNVRPVAKLALRSEVHTLRLADATDFWYSGGGAFQPKTFGFTGRPSNGNRGLANVWDLSADYQFTRSFSSTFYYGHAWGKGVIASIYPDGANGQFIFVETDLPFLGRSLNCFIETGSAQLISPRIRSSRPRSSRRAAMIWFAGLSLVHWRA